MPNLGVQDIFPKRGFLSDRIHNPSFRFSASFLLIIEFLNIFAPLIKIKASNSINRKENKFQAACFHQ